MSIFNSPQSEPPNSSSRRSKRLNKPKSKSKSHNNRKPKPIDNAELKDNNDNNDNNTDDNNNNNNNNSVPPSPKSPSLSLSSSHTTSSKRKSKIFNIFNSPKSEPPPLPSCEKLAQATSLPTISTNTNKSRRKRNNKKHHRGSSENSGGSQFEKLKSIISGLFPKKSVSTKPRKKRKRKKLGRSRSFSVKKNNNDSNNNHNNNKNNNNNNNNNNKNNKNKNKKNKMRKPKKKSKKSKKSRKSNSDFELDINNMNNINNNNNKNKKRKKKERANSANNMLSIVNTAAWMDDFNEETERELELQRELEKELELKIEIELESDEIEQESPFKSEIRKIKRDTMNSMLKKAVLDQITEVDEDVDFSLSETEEYKDDFHDVNGLPLATRPALAPKSSSCMRTFEKRPEYTTYYPPASLMEVFNNITVDDEERSVTLETKQGIKQRLDSVDQLFELATRGNMDYSAFYGHQNSNNYAAHELGLQSLSNKIMNSSSHSHSNTNNNFLNIDFNDNDYELNPITTTPTIDVSVLSSLPEYDDEYDENDEYRHCMAWE